MFPLTDGQDRLQFKKQVRGKLHRKFNVQVLQNLLTSKTMMRKHNFSLIVKYLFHWELTIYGKC